MDYKCSHCGSTKTEIEEKTNQIGLYCTECGKLIKWLSKDEARVLKHKKTNHDQEIYDKAIRDFAQKLMSRLPMPSTQRLLKAWQILQATKREPEMVPFLFLPKSYILYLKY